MQTLPSLLPLAHPNRMTHHARREQYLMLIAILGTLWLVLTLVGCAKNTQTGNPAESTAVATPPPPAPAAVAAPVTDTTILAALEEGDSAEIAMGKLALQKSKNPEVKGFANMMISDHSKMWNAKKDLAKKLKITPQLPADDKEPAHLADEMNSFNAAPTPMAFDTVYIDDAVADHTQVLAIVKDFETKATAPELKGALKNAEPVVQKHLDHAKMIQRDLSKPRPMAAGRKTK